MAVLGLLTWSSQSSRKRVVNKQEDFVYKRNTSVGWVRDGASEERMLGETGPSLRKVWGRRDSRVEVLIWNEVGTFLKQPGPKGASLERGDCDGRGGQWPGQSHLGKKAADGKSGGLPGRGGFTLVRPFGMEVILEKSICILGDRGSGL